MQKKRGIGELSEAQLSAAELLAKGESQIKTAQIVNVNVKTIQRWLKIEMFKAEVAKNVSFLKYRVEEKISMNIEPLMNRLINIALKSDSDKTSLDAIVYAVNRIVGTPTNKTQDVTMDVGKDEVMDIDAMLEELHNNDADDNSNVVDLSLKKAK